MSAPLIGAAPRTRIMRYQGATLIRRFVEGSVSQAAERKFKCIVATAAKQSDGLALDMAGGDYSRFQNGGPLLDNHNSEEILGTIQVQPTATQLLGNGRWTSPGVSKNADQRWRELQDGVLRWFSIGFLVDERERLAGGGWRATKWTLIEVSTTSVPVDSAAVVTERARARRNRRMDEAMKHLRAARESAQLINERTRGAFEAHARGDHSAVHRSLRAIESHAANLETAHDALSRALGAEPEYVDPTHDLDSQGGAQVSNGQASRSLSYEQRQRELRDLASRA